MEIEIFFEKSTQFMLVNIRRKKGFRTVENEVSDKTLLLGIENTIYY